MNKVILMGRLTKDPEKRYSQGAEPVAVTRYGIAVNRRFKREGEPDADFFNCVAFRQAGEFADKYFRKGQMVGVVGSLQNHSWDDQATGQKRYATDIIVDEQYFAESKASFESRKGGDYDYTQNPVPYSGGRGDGGFDINNAPKAPQGGSSGAFMPIEDNIDDEDLPF